MWCIINLPNGTQQAVKWDPKGIGQDCLEKICKSLDIVCEMEYFGLEHWNPDHKVTRTPQWINLRNRLTHDSSSGVPLMLALRVKFWVPVHFLLQESVRNLFYMQAKSDLLEGRLNTSDWTKAAKLAALLCQADGIHFNEKALKSVCPIRMKQEQEILLQQQQQQQQEQQQKERKEKDHALSLKKRRLSKQKSVDNIDNICQSTICRPKITHASTIAEMPAAATASALSSLTSSTTLSSRKASIYAENESTISLLSIYQNYIVRPADDLCSPMPDDFLRKIAAEHGKLSLLKMSPKSAKYWLLQELQELPGYGEEVFSGITTGENSTRCDISVGAHGITVSKVDNKSNIRFSAISAAKSFRRSFKLEYIDDHNECSALEIKLSKHALASGLYRSITERHAFYVCDKVRGVVTNQFTRDLKGTIASMFKEDTELGKRYVFDIQHTCREVHDQARRILHERGVEMTASAISSGGFDEILQYLPKPPEACDRGVGIAMAAYARACAYSYQSCTLGTDLDIVMHEKNKFETVVERCVDTRISEAMTCKICMDNQINSMFSPCCHVMACLQCASRCSNCPNCRVKVTNYMRIYLPTELRTSQSAKRNDAEENIVAGSSGTSEASSEHKPTLCSWPTVAVEV